MDEKKPHQPHTLGAPSSQETPLRGVEPNRFHCPFCEKTFKTRTGMERHKDTMHHETKGHQ